MFFRPRLTKWSLRTLLLVTAAAAVFFAYLGHRARQQRAAIQAVLEAGGTIAYDFELDAQGNEMNATPSPVPTWLGPLGNDTFCSIALVRLHRNPKLTDERLQQVCDYLPALPRLRHLNFYSIDFTEEEFSRLRNLSDLERLSLHTCKLQDGWLGYLPQSNRLRHLNVNYVSLGDEGFKMLTHQRGLTLLSAIGTKVTDDGLRYLEGLPLTDLDVARTGITDHGLAHLARVPTLIRLNAYGGPQISDEGIKTLTTAVPGVTVSR